MPCEHPLIGQRLGIRLRRLHQRIDHSFRIMICALHAGRLQSKVSRHTTANAICIQRNALYLRRTDNLTGDGFHLCSQTFKAQGCHAPEQLPLQGVCFTQRGE